MQEKLVLISDDSDFFEYIIPKLALRKSDELYKFGFDELPEKVHLLESALLIINSEHKQEQTLELLNITKNSPAVIFGYNDDEDFKIRAYQSGMFAYFTPATSEKEIRAKLLPALKLVSSINKNKLYREILVKNNLLTKNNEVFLDSNNLLEREIEKINKSSAYAVLAAISPDDKSKFSLLPNQIETIILNNIRENDILINYATNKYYLLLLDTDLNNAKAIWDNIASQFPEPIYAGFAFVGHKNRQLLVNEVLNNLHLAINKGFNSSVTADMYSGNNFVQNRNELEKKLEQIITPVFYHLQQTYNDKLFEMKIEQEHNNDSKVMYIKSKNNTGIFKITCPGFSTVNIDISYDTDSNINLESKRISIEPEHLEGGFLQDILEQFIMEFKREVNNDNS